MKCVLPISRSDSSREGVRREFPRSERAIRKKRILLVTISAIGVAPGHPQSFAVPFHGFDRSMCSTPWLIAR
jgi:hypothetical protein